jgi:hypothetical protein
MIYYEMNGQEVAWQYPFLHASLLFLIHIPANKSIV